MNHEQLKHQKNWENQVKWELVKEPGKLVLYSTLQMFKNTITQIPLWINKLLDYILSKFCQHI